jgi:three-Cys-motif partner protein
MAHMKKQNQWGGEWTEQKLDAFAKYVSAYLTIMNCYRDKCGWKLIYFDGFAGSGRRSNDAIETSEQDSLLNSLQDEELIHPNDFIVYRGAAERVLSINQKGFDFYYFIDKDKESSDSLKRLLKEKSLFKQGLEFRTDDANIEVCKMAEAMHKNKNLRSLTLLDPFGMQVDWQSIEKLKDTKVDLWILVPTGVIVNRLLDRRGELTHVEKLVSFFGLQEDAIRAEFYNKVIRHTLFGDETVIEKIERPIEKIASLYNDRLKTIFKYVTPKPLVLYNSRNVPIYHFVCASDNQTAVKIATSIIGGIK